MERSGGGWYDYCVELVWWVWGRGEEGWVSIDVGHAVDVELAG